MACGRAARGTELGKAGTAVQNQTMATPIEERAKVLERASRDNPEILDRDELLSLVGPGPWTVRMHVCRMLPRVAWTAKERAVIIPFLFAEANGDNKFVQAWALDALASFAVTDESIRLRVAALLEAAIGDGPPSVRVRAREGLKLLSSK